jgi:xanthine dehydrogenase small subunit
VIRITKLSKRFDSDISAVCAAFHLTVAGGVIRRAHRLWRHGGHPPARPRHRGGAGRPPFAEATIEAAIPAWRRITSR